MVKAKQRVNESELRSRAKNPGAGRGLVMMGQYSKTQISEVHYR